ncbi:MAG: carbohydrate-binding protein, partial [Oscillospiraceae bacterium]|nr:carbohydrate-binding protein [Oscillospiraceae bacterium]
NVQQWGFSYSKCQNWKAEKIEIPKETEPATEEPAVETLPSETVPEPTENVAVIMGDVSQDAVVNIFDLLALKRSLLNGNTLPASADVNGDGSADASDIRFLQDFLLGKKVSFTAVSPAFDEAKHYYAIDAEGYDGWEETTNSGFEGKAYWNYNNALGSYLKWNVTVPETSDYQVTFRYANGASDDRAMKIAVNGETNPDTFRFGNTGSWMDWKETTILLPLKAGTNTIKAESATANGGPNVDYLRLAKFDASALSSNGCYFAVDQSWEEGIIETTNSGYTSEKGYINLENNDTSNITFTVSVPETGNYMTHIRFANGSADDRQMKVYVNGDTSRFWLQSFTGTGAWTAWTEFGLVLPLKKGINTIRLVSAVAQKGGPNLDYITLTPTDEPYGETYDPNSYQQMLDASKPTVFILGDSTVQSYRASYAPQQGWGYYLTNYFTDAVNVDNRSMAGRSSKKAYDEGRWKSLADSMKAGDCVLIQFAINDAGKSNADRYAPVCGNVNAPASGSYEWYMTQFINDAKARGGTPVLVTTVIGMGAYSSSAGKFQNSYADYCNACKSLSGKYHIPCIDLNTIMVNHYNAVGYDTAKSYHLAGAVAGSADGTHFCEKGADVVAGLVANEIKNQKISGLSGYVK